MKTVTTIHAAVSAWVFCVCWSGASSIRVKFGTNDGPIVPPTPTPSVAPVPPFRAPAPVWEDRRDDLPDPNTTWRPLFVPNPRYTQVNYNPAPLAQPAPTAVPAQSSAQRFVSAYLPKSPAAPATASQPSPPSPFFKAAPTQQAESRQGAQLSSHSVPGLGIRYFVPVYQPVERKEQTDTQEDKQNHIDDDSISEQRPASAHDAQLNYEKESTRRARHSLEASHNVVPVYQYQFQWPVYVPYRHQ